MNVAEIKAELTSIYDELIDTVDGAHWSALVHEFNARFPDARFEIGADLFDDTLKRKALDVMSTNDRANRVQLALPGLNADWDATVTLPDGEGSFRRKRLEHATGDDLRADYEIHRANVEAARAALQRAEDRNDALLPPMNQHGFKTAGEAIAWLQGRQP